MLETLPQKKEGFMNKNSKNDFEMLDDYADILETSNLSHAVRGKYYQRYQNLQGKIPVTIKTQEGDRHIILHTIKAKAKIEANGKLVADIASNLSPGEYQITIMIEEPQKSTHEST